MAKAVSYKRLTATQMYRICFLVLALHGSCATTKILEEDSVPMSETQAAKGGQARMTCDISPTVPGDRAQLVIWYKDGASTPIYSFDARTRTLEQGKHWSDENTLRGRAFFRYNERPAKLTLESVTDADGGVYRCRVDFKKSPTRNSRVNLNVIVPPEKLIFLDANGGTIQQYNLGPFNEGTNVEITCVAIGGRPPPRVTWWRDNTLLDDSWQEIPEKRMVRNTLRLLRVTRKQLHAEFTCQATTSSLSQPMSSAIKLDLNLRPLRVNMAGKNSPLSADSTYELKCEAIGSRPPPVFSWLKGGVPLRNTREMTSPEGNSTTSILTFSPAMEDSGKRLTCRAANPLMPDSAVEDSWRLEIYHVPVVSLELGSSLNASQIKEGQDVYFECNIKSNPWVYKVSWRHNGKPLYNNASAGAILTNQSLVLQAVTRSRAGLYTCVGSNNEGDGESNPVYLDIKYAPVCAFRHAQVYGLARHEAARIACEVEANPTEGLAFSWRFNNSAEAVDVPSALVSVERSRSVAVYTPSSELDYGSLQCWARNELGEQRKPCVFHVFPAGRPDPPHNCSIVNQTADALHVECSEGFDGGLPQEFVMEVYDAATQALVGNVTSRTPVFTVSGLQAGLGFDISLLATNSKGRSRPVPLHAYTLQPAERRSAVHNMQQLFPLIGILAGAVVAVIGLAVAVVILVVRVRRRRTQGYDKASAADMAVTDAYKETSSAADAASSSDSVDDNNPDIIPAHNSDAEPQNGDTTLGNCVRRKSSVSLNLTQDLYTQTSVKNSPNNIRYLNRNGDDVTYIELSLPKPQGGSVLYTPGGTRHSQGNSVRFVQEPTVYAEIDNRSLQPHVKQPFNNIAPGYHSLQRPGHRQLPRPQPVITANGQDHASSPIPNIPRGNATRF